MPITLTPTSANYEGRYTSEAQLVQFLGQYGVDVYADVDGDGSADTGAVQQAIVTAEGTVDFRTGGPFTVTPDTVGSAMLEKWSRILAAVEIAQKRLGIDATAVAALRTLRQEAYDEMELYRTGVLAMPGATPPEDTTTADAWEADEPISVLPTVDQDGRTVSDPPPKGFYYDPNAPGIRWQ